MANRPDNISMRVALLTSGVPNEIARQTTDAMTIVDEAASEFARAVETVKNSGVTYDYGRVVAGLDAILHAKTILHDALLLPHCRKETQTTE